jgi:hypothetical protein
VDITSIRAVVENCKVQDLPTNVSVLLDTLIAAGTKGTEEGPPNHIPAVAELLAMYEDCHSTVAVMIALGVLTCMAGRFEQGASALIEVIGAEKRPISPEPGVNGTP